jgi:hypothetical protein
MKFEINTVPDDLDCNNPFPKNWFHFNVEGLNKDTTYRFIIRNVNLLWPLYNVLSMSDK